MNAQTPIVAASPAKVEYEIDRPDKKKPGINIRLWFDGGPVECEMSADIPVEELLELATDDEIERDYDERDIEVEPSLNADDVADLARAIRAGDRDEAERALDRIVSDAADSTLEHRVSIARYGGSGLRARDNLSLPLEA